MMLAGDLSQGGQILERERMSKPVFVPYLLIPGELKGLLLEEFVTREGTDYGEVELTLEAKIEILERQLRAEEAVIAFNPDDESFQVVDIRDARTMGYSMD